MRGKATCPKTYTFRAQDVYVSLGKAIRLALSPSKVAFSKELCELERKSYFYIN